MFFQVCFVDCMHENILECFFKMKISGSHPKPLNHNFQGLDGGGKAILVHINIENQCYMLLEKAFLHLMSHLQLWHMML